MTMPAIDLRAERLNRGLSLIDLAAQIGVHHDVIRRAEEGLNTPYPRHAHKIASFYGYRVTDIWPVEREPQEAA